MTINTFVLSGEVKRIDVNNKPAKKGPAAVAWIQYGPSRQRTEQSVQFVNVALVRIPPYVYEKCKDHLKVGCLADVTGHVQGVLKHIVTEGFVTNELVADRFQVVDADELEEEQPSGLGIDE
ncbi:signal recognition particle protein [Novimethylophilus kurashikiensis]|uniref:Signal recognition particle protein n=1 Tax=Novimethylophilus kurashikiensis TaxID=1825523 RepID=A0A2R5F849_9PROT|nr:hypothetical protein [Novimethylophilus kurashikiensis]GBG14396.1 signal recognition particle protein [Novimethylophilus kurashikiensis]